jgi:hypothetical protein
MNGPKIIEMVLAPGFVTLNLAYVALLVGAFCASMNRVRVLLVLSAMLFVAYGSIQHIASLIVWNLVIGGLNLHRLMAGLWAEARVSLTAEQERHWRNLFSDLAPGDFQRLWELGSDVLCSDELLVETGLTPDRLYLLLRGTVHIRRGETVLDELGPGAIIGRAERTPFLSPSADWRAAGAVWLRSWSLADLAEAKLKGGALGFLAGDGHVTAGAGAR